MENFLKVKDFAAAGLYEEPERSLFYKKALGLRRFFETCELPRYRGELLYPSGRVRCPNFMTGLAVDWKALESREALAERIKEDFCRDYKFVPEGHRVGGHMYNHSIPHYERVLEEGFVSYIPRIRKIKDRELREGLLHLLEGIDTYVSRCVSCLEAAGAEDKLICALKQVPMKPARDLYEAVVCWNFVLYLDGCDNLGCVASGLMPYYRGENIVPLLQNLFENLNDNNGYSMALGTDYNPLTLQCLEAAKGKRRPMIQLFVQQDTPAEVWEKAFELLRTVGGQPAFYDPDLLLGGLKRKFSGISDEDIKKFCGGGCTESMLAGLSNVGSLDAGINLLLLLERCMYEQLEEAGSFEDFYRRYMELVRETVDAVTRGICKSQKERSVSNPLPMRTLLVDDCIEKGLDYHNGGARYGWSIVSFAGLINVIDGLLVIRDLIFEEKTWKVPDFLKKLKENDIAFLKELRNHPLSFGKDQPEVNAFAAMVSKEIYSMLEDKKPYLGEGFLPASILFQHQVAAGLRVGATPDGREACAPLADSLGAIFGKDTKGPTALLNSVTALDLERALGVPVLNFNINPDFKNEILKALILGYMRQGGIQMQITCISRELLEEAYRDPDSHKNLVVRVGGYSEYFCRLTDELKRMVIDRTIQGGV